MDLRNDIITKLKACPQVKKAWIARKQVKYFQDIPALVIAVTLKGWLSQHDRILDQLSQEFADSTCSVFIFSGGGTHKRLAKKIVQIGEQII